MYIFFLHFLSRSQLNLFQSSKPTKTYRYENITRNSDDILGNKSSTKLTWTKDPGTKNGFILLHLGSLATWFCVPVVSHWVKVYWMAIILPRRIQNWKLFCWVFVQKNCNFISFFKVQRLARSTMNPMKKCNNKKTSKWYY